MASNSARARARQMPPKHGHTSKASRRGRSGPSGARKREGDTSAHGESHKKARSSQPKHNDPETG